MSKKKFIFFQNKRLLFFINLYLVDKLIEPNTKSFYYFRLKNQVVE